MRCCEQNRFMTYLIMSRTNTKKILFKFEKETKESIINVSFKEEGDAKFTLSQRKP